MKHTLEPGTPHPGEQKRHLGVPDAASRTVPRLAAWLAAITACACFTGCLSPFKPARPIARYFVLTPLPVAAPVAVAPVGLALSVGPVKIPTYLYGTSLAVRKGTNEIDYLTWALWAERLDKGIYRTLAANLSTLLAPDPIRLTAWRSGDASTEVSVAIGQFDVDAGGQGVLVVWWRILSPGGEKTLRAGKSRFVRQGPSPDADPAGAVATLSELVAELSRELAQVIKETMPTAR